jgi:hypothetical protein
MAQLRKEPPLFATTANLLTALQCDTVGKYRNPKVTFLSQATCRFIDFIDVRYFLPTDYITRL